MAAISAGVRVLIPLAGQSGLCGVNDAPVTNGSLPQGCRRHVANYRFFSGVAPAFKAIKEIGAILYDWTTKGAAENVSNKLRSRYSLVANLLFAADNLWVTRNKSALSHY